MLFHYLIFRLNFLDKKGILLLRKIERRGKMKKLNTIVRGTASIFNSTSAVNVDNIFKKYPTAHDKTVKEALQHSWDTVGIAIKGAISNYGKENTYK